MVIFEKLKSCNLKEEKTSIEAFLLITVIQQDQQG